MFAICRKDDAGIPDGASACCAINQRLKDGFAGCQHFRRCSFSYSIRLISSISALSCSEPCSTAACSHSCVHCSFTFPGITRALQSGKRRTEGYEKHMTLCKHSAKLRLAPNWHWLQVLTAACFKSSSESIQAEWEDFPRSPGIIALHCFRYLPRSEFLPASRTPPDVRHRRASNLQQASWIQNADRRS